jgi:glycosyltransferase involved in cell wall biosynthesis
LRILYLAPDPVTLRKGSAVRIAQTLTALRELGHEVESFTPEPPAEAEAREPNFLRRALAFREQAARWLSGRRGDLVQFRSPWEGLPALDWARRHGARAVYEAHGFPSIELPYHYPGLRTRFALLEKLAGDERMLLVGADRVLTPSRTGALHLRRLGVPAGRIGVVGNAVDTELFRPAPVAPPDVPPLRVVYTGTLAPWQGLSTLLEALALLRGSPPLELHVIGPARATWRHALRTQARVLRVHHALHLSAPMAQADLLPVLQTAHLCVAPLPDDARNAVQGCCPIKLLEYMAAGRPILATRVAPVEEILEHGRTAHLVRAGSAADLAAGLRFLAAHPAEREALGAAARERAVEAWQPARLRSGLQESLRAVAGLV